MHRIVHGLRRSQPVQPGAIKPRRRDTWLVSYPRSGNTWARIVLANYIWSCPRIENLTDLQTYVPDAHVLRPEVEPLRFTRGRRLIKSHKPARSDYRRVIYLFRSPFDCAWSYFRFVHDWRGEFDSFEDFVAAFLRGSLPYGRWDSHLLGWWEIQKSTGLFISYDDLVSDPIACFGEMIESLGLERKEPEIERALAEAAPERVAQITNDEDFYGKKFTRFVQAPLGMGLEAREEARAMYSREFEPWNDLYLRMKDGEIR